MATWVSTQTGNGEWENDAANANSPWFGGGNPASGYPTDGDGPVTITAGHDVEFGHAMSTGFVGNLTIQGHATTPATVRFKNDVGGEYKMAFANTYGILGTSGAQKGRLMLGGGTWGTPAELDPGIVHRIDFLGTAAGKLTGQYIAFQSQCRIPSLLYCRPYGQKVTITGRSGNLLLCSETGTLANGTEVCITHTGTLPGGLLEDVLYYIVNLTNDTSFSLSLKTGGTPVELTSDGTVGATVYTGVGSGVTDLTVLEDLTSDAAWGVETPLRVTLVNSLAGTAYDIQRRVTATSPGNGTITISEVTDNAQKPGAKLFLCTRNVAIASATTSGSQNIISFTSNSDSGYTLACELYMTAGTGTTFYAYAFAGVTAHLLGGVVHDCNYVTNNGSDLVMNGVIVACAYPVTVSGTVLNGIISGCPQCYYYPTSGTISATGIVEGCTNAASGANALTNNGVIRGCQYAMYTSATENGANTNNGRISNCGTGIHEGRHFAQTEAGSIIACTTGVHYTHGTISGVIESCTTAISGSHVTLQGAILRENTTDLNVSVVSGYGAWLASSTQWAWSTATTVPDWRQSVIYDVCDANGAVQPGYVKGWMKSGTIITEAAPGSPSPALDYAYKMEPSSATVPLFLDFPMFVKAGETLDIDVYVYLAATGMDGRPRVQLIDPNEPFDSAASKLYNTQAANTATTWETLNATWENTTGADKQVTLRCTGYDATDDWYWMFAPQAGLGPTDAEIAEAAWEYANRTLTG